MVHFQNTQKSHEKNLKSTRKEWIKKEFFTKHPQVSFYLIETFFGPNPSSLRLLITLSLNCDRFDWGKWSKIKPRSFWFKVSFKTLFFFFSALIFILICFFCLVYVCLCLSRLVLGFLHIFKHDRLLDCTFWVSALFLCWLGFYG